MSKSNPNQPVFLNTTHMREMVATHVATLYADPVYRYRGMEGGETVVSGVVTGVNRLVRG